MFEAAGLTRRVAAYLVVLVGYLFYCYNFNVVDYIRPYLVSEYKFTLTQTATFSVAANIGITLGAIGWATFIAWAGLRRAVFAIAATIGTVGALHAMSDQFAVWFSLRGLMAAALAGYYIVAISIVVALAPPSMRGKLIALNFAMYPLSNMMLGGLGASLGDANWHVLVWLGAVPLLVAPLAFILVPSGKGGNLLPIEQVDVSRPELLGGWRAMLSPRWRKLTLGCIILSGIDFNAYQLFASFMTVYMKQELAYSAAQVGATIALFAAGQLGGGFFWAWLADRYGRRIAAVGYLIAAAAVLVFLFGGLSGTALSAVALIFGIGLSCTTAWGVWFAELFPERLRPYGTALFQGGHVIALGAPLFFAFASPVLGLQLTMSIAAAIYVLGFVVWIMLPETLGRDQATD